MKFVHGSLGLGSNQGPSWDHLGDRQALTGTHLAWPGVTHSPALLTTAATGWGVQAEVSSCVEHLAPGSQCTS